MKFLDLFAGVGGIRLGMEQAGHECVGWVEWDKFARKSYVAIHKPDGEYTEKDINNVNSQELPKADCWCFGFPCQDISVAGKQGGFTNGKRSSLFFKVTGLIRELKEEDKPSYLFIENVKNLLSINKGWDFAKLLIEMDEIGYDVEWDVLDSAEVVPQHRERIFIIGHLRGRSTRKVFPIERENGSTSETNEIVRLFNGRQEGTYGSQDILSPDGISTTLNTMSGGGREPKIVAMGNINPSGKGINGNVYSSEGISPTINTNKGEGAKIAIREATMQGGGREPKILDDQGRTNKRLKPLSMSPTLRSQSHGNEPKVAVREATKIGYDVAQLGDSINFSQPNSKTRRGRVGHGVANTLTTSIEQATLIQDTVTDSDSLETITNVSQGVKAEAKPAFGRFGQQAADTMNANEVSDFDIIEPFNHRVHKDQVSPTLTTRPEGLKTAILPVTNNLRIRKLTPLECWRLQGFPDWAFNHAKQAGNSVTVPVIKAIADRMEAEEEK